MKEPHKLRRLGDLTRAIAYRQSLIKHECWPRTKLEELQQRRLADLLDWVTQKSPFYREYTAHIDWVRLIVSRTSLS